MGVMVRAKVIKIGNSRGIRIPRVLLDQAGLTDEVEMMVERDRLVVYPAKHPRQNWGQRFMAMAEHGDDHLLDPHPTTRWEEDEWEW